MAENLQARITAHRCTEFEEATMNSKMPKNENGDIGHVPAVILHYPNKGWMMVFVDMVRMPCSFCPFCGKRLQDG